MSAQGSESDLGGDEGNLLDYALVVWRYWWLVLGICIAVVLVTFVVTITTPKVYESTTTILVPKEGVGAGLLGGLAASGLAQSGLVQQVAGISLPSFTPNRDMLTSILKSRTAAQVVVDRFRLQERYRALYLEDAIKGLQGATKVSVSREGVISVRVEDADPKVAAQIANFYAEQLDRLVARFGTGEAGRQRVFLTEQLARAKTDLESVEEALRRFQERNRAIALQDQTRGAITAAARLKGEIMASEVQLQVMRNFATEANPEMVALRRRIDEMNRQLAQMQYGDDASESQTQTPARDRRDFTVPFPKVPEVGIELARLTRDVKVQETLVMLLTQQVEQVRLAEAKDLPVVQVLDRAVAAERPSRPRLKLNLAVATAGSLLLGVSLALAVEHLRKLSRRARAA